MTRNLLDFFRKPKRPERILIETPFGYVTESQRLQAAINIKSDETIRDRVLAVLAKELGSVAKAEVEMRRRYPEAYDA